MTRGWRLGAGGWGLEMIGQDPRTAGRSPAPNPQPPVPTLWLDQTPRPGWENMAIDSALLDWAESTGLYCWRLYRWEPFCLSFGCHEPAARRYDRARIEALGLDTVRRPTGGRAVWHARELTYAVAAPIAIFGSVPNAYATIHAILARAIASLGATPALAPRRTTPGVGSGACFASPVGGEIVIAGKKVVGSAQKKGETAFLQHGSVLLEDDQSTVRAVQLNAEPIETEPPEAPLSALLGRPIPFAEAARAIEMELGSTALAPSPQPQFSTMHPPVTIHSNPSHGPGRGDRGNHMHLIRSPAWLALGCLAGPLAAQAAPKDHGTITIVIGAEPTLPIPTLSNFKPNTDVASLLFLRLARMGKTLETTAESEFEPQLARRWIRKDSLTIVFELDPRARWHDGVPVTSKDVVWTLNRSRDSTISPTYALLLRRISSVSADGPTRVVVKFRERYAEQLYDAVWHVSPLPAHLLDTIPPNRLATSSFVSNPVGDGPYRWGKFEPGQKLELVSNPDFFLGAPKLDRIVFLLIRNSEAQLNAVLDGTADAFEGVLLQKDIGPIVGRPSLRIVTYPSYTIAYLLLNERAPGDRSKPHPILSDPAVRRAITMAIDRPTLLRATFGPYAIPIHGPMGQASWIRREAPKSPGYDPKAAKALLMERGWTDSDGDGFLDQGGRPLTLKLNYPGSSMPRVALAEPIQQMLKQVGINVELVRLEGQVWVDRRNKGDFDIDFSQVSVDPTPSGLVQSWGCAGIGGTNVGSVCSPPFDSAFVRAAAAAVGAKDAWNRALARLVEYAPAVFLYSPAQIAIVSGRYQNVSFRSEATWTDLWRWSVDPSQRIARDER